MKSKKIYKPSKKRIKWILLILIFFILWAGFTIYSQKLDLKEKKKMIEQLEKNENEALIINEELKNKVHLLQDYEYIAELARKYYFLSKPGEYIFISPEE